MWSCLARKVAKYETSQTTSNSVTDYELEGEGMAIRAQFLGHDIRVHILQAHQ